MPKKFLTLILLLVFFFSLPKNKTQAATFSLNPLTKSLNQGENLEVKIHINTEGEAVIGAGAVLEFDPDILEFSGATAGLFFSTFSFSKSSGKIDLAGTVGLGGTGKSGQDSFANLTLKAKTGGVSPLKFLCGRPVDSNINKENPADPANPINIINCPSLQNGQYTVLAAGVPTVTPPGGGNPPPGGNGAVSTTCDFCGYCQGGTKPADYERCLACLYENPGPPPTNLKEDSSWTVIGCLPTKPATFIQKVLGFAVSLAGGISFLLLLFAGFKILTSKGDPTQLAAGKNLLVSTIIALLLILFAVFFLKFIGFEILKIPGFG